MSWTYPHVILIFFIFHFHVAHIMYALPMPQGHCPIAIPQSCGLRVWTLTVAQKTVYMFACFALNHANPNNP